MSSRRYSNSYPDDADAFDADLPAAGPLPECNYHLPDDVWDDLTREDDDDDADTYTRQIDPGTERLAHGVAAACLLGVALYIIGFGTYALLKWAFGAG